MSGQVGHARPDAAPAALLPAPLRPVAVPAIAVLLAAVLLGALVLAAVQSDTASAATELVEGEAVTATLADGTTTALAPGDEVPDGATVAAPSGAVLRTRDRDVLLGPAARVTVLDGARQVLGAGFVVVDARRGPGVDVETPAAVVTTPGGAVSRIEPRVVLRVGAFAGDAVEVRAVGRQASVDVEALRQVQVPVGGLPGRVTPLALTGDAYERRVAPELVAADRALYALGRTLDSSGEQGPAVLAALRVALPTVAAADPAVVAASAAGTPADPSPAPRSEPALAFLLAAAPEPDAGRLAERYTEVRGLRAAGGSWGVVARLVDTSTSAVSSLLDRLLSPLVLVAGQTPVDDVLALLAPSAGPAAGAAPGSSADSGAGTPAGPAAPGPAPGPGAPPPPPQDPPSDPPPDDEEPPPPGPGPVPPPPDDPVETLEETVEVVVDTVIGLLPSPPPSAAPPAPAPPPTATTLVTPPRPAPAPAPSPTPPGPLPAG